MRFLRLRNSIGNHIYLQYTATPQAPLLINLTEILSQDWHVVLDAGKGYFGEILSSMSEKAKFVSYLERRPTTAENP